MCPHPLGSNLHRGLRASDAQRMWCYEASGVCSGGTMPNAQDQRVSTVLEGIEPVM